MKLFFGFLEVALNNFFFSYFPLFKNERIILSTYFLYLFVIFFFPILAKTIHYKPKHNKLSIRFLISGKLLKSLYLYLNTIAQFFVEKTGKERNYFYGKKL